MIAVIIFAATIVGALLTSVVVRLWNVRTWQRATARVISLGPSRSNTESTIPATMYPVLSFRSSHGCTITVVDERFSFGPAVPGDELEVLYYAEDPTKVVPAQISVRFRMEFVLMVFALSFLLIVALTRDL